MREKTLKSIMCCIVVWICCSNVFAMDLLGPPNAELAKGQLSYLIEHSYSRFALDFDFRSGSWPMRDFSRSRMKMDTLSGRIGYGVKESIEGFAYMGWARILNSEDSQRLDADGRVYGLGAKVTFWEYYLVKWGALVQAGLTSTDGTWSRYRYNWIGDADVDFMHILVAGGANYQLTESLCMYGGPLWYYLDGEKEYKEISPDPEWYENYDFKNKSMFGVYIGLQMDIPANAKLNFECQKTCHDNMLALGVVWKF